MKPTKEQLADPRWWDENANGYDYVFYLERNDEYIFADDNGEGINFKLIVGAAGWQLLAKRPESNWVPEVGGWCEVESDTRNVWKKAMYVGVDSMGSHVFDVEKRHLWRIDSIGTLVRPIKTQREEFVERAIDVMNSSIDDSQQGWAEALFDSGLFDLSEKDGN